MSYGWERFCGRSVYCLLLMALVSLSPAADSRPVHADALTDELRNLEQRVSSGSLGNVHSVLVIQKGRLTAEWYFQGTDERRGRTLGVVKFTADSLHDVRSISKSVMSILVGLAIADGKIKSLDEPILNYFPEYGDLRTPERMKIRLRDVISMTSGLHWDERTYPYTDERNSETAMDRVADRYRFILSQPIDAAPGTRFNYSGGSVALIAAVIARAIGEPIDAYARQRLFEPLGIVQFEWLRDAAGIPIAASGLRLRSRDMATIGQMMLQNGRWNGVQLVPAEWVTQSTSPRTQLKGDTRCGLQYGYLWWLGALCLGEERIPLVFASGNGGQYIWIVPSLELVIVTTAGLYNVPLDPLEDKIAIPIIEAVEASVHPAH